MKKYTLGFTLLSILLLTSCKKNIDHTTSLAQNPTVNSQTKAQKLAETKKVQKVLANWVEAFNNKDGEALFSLYDPESVYASPRQRLLKGISEVRPWYEQGFSSRTGNLKYKEEVITVEENMAVIILKFYVKPAEINKAAAPFKGRAMLVFRKSKDGKWLLLFDMDNSPPDIFVEDF